MFTKDEQVYFLNTQAEYRTLIKKTTGQQSASSFGPFTTNPPRIFGPVDVGDGTLSHEIVHVLIMNDWTNIPGWFNEGLAVSLGCPLVGVRTDRIYVKDVHMYVAIRALNAGTWFSLGKTLPRKTTRYGHDDAIALLFGSAKVGP